MPEKWLKTPKCPKFGFIVQVSKSPLFSRFLAKFRAFSGSFWPRMKYRAFLGKVSTPDTTKIFVGILSEISGEIRSFGQYGNTVRFPNLFCLHLRIGGICKVLHTQPLSDLNSCFSCFYTFYKILKHLFDYI